MLLKLPFISFHIKNDKNFLLHFYVVKHTFTRSAKNPSLVIFLKQFFFVQLFNQKNKYVRYSIPFSCPYTNKWAFGIHSYLMNLFNKWTNTRKTASKINRGRGLNNSPPVLAWISFLLCIFSGKKTGQAMCSPPYKIHHK